MTMSKHMLFSFSLICLATFVQCSIVSLSNLPTNEFSSEKLSAPLPAFSRCVENEKLLMPQNGLRDRDRIGRLPGQPRGVTFNQYAGYVTVDSKAGRALFYYFVELQDKSSQKPLVLWLNGGPGCSSIGYGAFEQIGPFRVSSDGKTLYQNEYTWNKEANIIFLEAPAGTGFSYSNSTSDYEHSSDDGTVGDAYVFLANWFERFPQYKSRDFYVAGESYAGHFVPKLAHLILLNNKCSNMHKIELQGIAVGNGLLDNETYYIGRVDYYWSHALISDELYRSLKSECDFSKPNGLSTVCNQYVDLAFNSQPGNIDPDEIYAPFCNSTSKPDTTFDPCSDNYVTSYLNTPKVQAALHANATQLPYPWEICSTKIASLWNGIPFTVLPVIEELISNGLRVWLYSGDADGLIPVTSTRYAINKLKLPVKTPWYPWYTNGEVGGRVVGYENLTFVTVRGAGHMAPSYQPARSLTVFSSFIRGKLPPSK